MESYLVHHGIKGQKWGVRRFQNSDGTYTEKGKRRRANKIVKSIKKEKLSSPYSRLSLIGTKTQALINNSFSKKQLTDLKASKEELNKTLRENAYDIDAVEEEIFDALEKNYSNYEKRARQEYIKEEGYDPGDDEDLWSWTYSIAEKDVYKKYPEIQKKEDNIYSAIDKHNKLLENISDQLLGEYGKMPYSKINGNKNRHETIAGVVDTALWEIDQNPQLLDALLRGK